MLLLVIIHFIENDSNLSIHVVMVMFQYFVVQHFRLIAPLVINSIGVAIFGLASADLSGAKMNLNTHL